MPPCPPERARRPSGNPQPIRIDEGFRLDLHHHVGVGEPAHAEQGVRGQEIAEHLVALLHAAAVILDVRYIGDRPDDVVQHRSDGTERLLERKTSRMRSLIPAARPAVPWRARALIPFRYIEPFSSGMKFSCPIDIISNIHSHQSHPESAFFNMSSKRKRLY